MKSGHCFFRVGLQRILKGNSAENPLPKREPEHGLSFKGELFRKRVFLLTESRSEFGHQTGIAGQKQLTVRGGTDAGTRHLHEVRERESREANVSGAFNDRAAERMFGKLFN